MTLNNDTKETIVSGIVEYEVHSRSASGIELALFKTYQDRPKTTDELGYDDLEQFVQSGIWCGWDNIIPEYRDLFDNDIEYSKKIKKVTHLNSMKITVRCVKCNNSLSLWYALTSYMVSCIKCGSKELQPETRENGKLHEVRRISWDYNTGFTIELETSENISRNLYKIRVYKEMIANMPILKDVSLIYEDFLNYGDIPSKKKFIKQTQTYNNSNTKAIMKTMFKLKE